MKNFLRTAVSAILLFSGGYAIPAELTEKSAIYWDNGNIKEETEFDLTGRLRFVSYYRYDGTLEKRERYDEYGHKTAVVNYEREGKLRANADGWAAILSWYDGRNLAVETYYGEDGRIKERKLYSESGKLIERQYRTDDSIDTGEEFEPGLFWVAQKEYKDPYGLREKREAGF